MEECQMFCKHCGNELNEDVLFCDKCGAKKTSEGETPQTNIFALIGVIIAGISIFLNFWGIVGIAAVIISSIGLVQINKNQEKGKNLAIIGISIGAFSILYAFILLLFLS